MHHLRSTYFTSLHKQIAAHNVRRLQFISKLQTLTTAENGISQDAFRNPRDATPVGVAFDNQLLVLRFVADMEGLAGQDCDSDMSLSTRSKSDAPSVETKSCGGLVLKRSDHLGKWNERWFAIENSRLIVYPDEKATVPQRIVALTDCSVTSPKAVGSGNLYEFSLMIPSLKKKYRLRVGGSRRAREWVEDFSKAIQLAVC